MIHRNCTKLAARVTISTHIAVALVSTVALTSIANATITEAVNGAVGLSASSYAVNASAGSVTLTVERVGGKTGAESVTYTTVGGTAAAGKQFTTETGTLTWATGDGANKTFKIPVATTAFAGTKDFAIRLTAGANTMLGAHTSATVAITGTAATTTTATSTAAGYIGMTAATYTASASTGSVVLTAQRTSGSTGAVSVTYSTVSGSAIAGTQFTSETGTLTWANGDAANKTFTIPLSKTAFTGTKAFTVRLAAGAGTGLGAHGTATVDITGTAATTTVATKSIQQWVSCSETIDETAQVKAAILAAANHAFTLVVDCPVRLHTGTASESSIAVPDGVTIEFTGSGEMLAVSNGPPGLTVANPAEVTFVNWNYTYL